MPTIQRVAVALALLIVVAYLGWRLGLISQVLAALHGSTPMVGRSLSEFGAMLAV